MEKLECSHIKNAQNVPGPPQSNLKTMIFTMQQNMMEIMSFMQTLVQNQNMVIRLIVAQQSK